jgi:pyruvate dehydrogenase E2 component (dihydrolipoamide acetyltransferase)
MAIPIKMPDLSTTGDTVTLIKWLKKEGDSVKRGDLLCEIETDKATNTLESIAEGTILKILVEEETEIEQGTVIAYIGTPEEHLPDIKDNASLLNAEKSTDHSFRSEDDVPKVPPLIRNLAIKYGIDLGTVTGTGPMGRITRDDVMKVKDIKVIQKIHNTEAISLSSNQKSISQRVLQSIHDIPPIHLIGEVDMTNLINRRESLKLKQDGKLFFDAFFVKNLASVMKIFPHFRSRFEDEKVTEKSDVNIGVAMSEKYNLYIPVIKNCDIKSVSEINDELQQLTKKVSENQLTTEDLSGATVSVSNLGMYPVRSFQAVIPPDQISILSIGTIKDTPIVNNGKVIILPVTVITLTVDHKLINGREAAEFLTFLMKEIESI